jgi:hypothetical protein
MEYPIKFIQELNRQICQLFRNDSFSFSFVVLFVAYLLLVLPRTYGINDNVGILFEATFLAPKKQQGPSYQFDKIKFAVFDWIT